LRSSGALVAACRVQAAQSDAGDLALVLTPYVTWWWQVAATGNGSRHLDDVELEQPRPSSAF
jgi:hypothetical protein